jgi:hypothetical protein
MFFHTSLPLWDDLVRFLHRCVEVPLPIESQSRREQARANGVDSDPKRLKRGGHELRELRLGGLGLGVGELADRPKVS